MGGISAITVLTFGEKMPLEKLAIKFVLNVEKAWFCEMVGKGNFMAAQNFPIVEVRAQFNFYDICYIIKNKIS